MTPLLSFNCINPKLLSFFNLQTLHKQVLFVDDLCHFKPQKLSLNQFFDNYDEIKVSK